MTVVFEGYLKSSNLEIYNFYTRRCSSDWIKNSFWVEWRHRRWRGTMLGEATVQRGRRGRPLGGQGRERRAQPQSIFCRFWKSFFGQEELLSSNLSLTLTNCNLPKIPSLKWYRRSEKAQVTIFYQSSDALLSCQLEQC